VSDDLISRHEAEQLLREYADEVGCGRGEYELANGILKAVGFISSSENVATARERIPSEESPVSARKIAKLAVQALEYDKETYIELLQNENYEEIAYLITEFLVQE
jgi:hypothetical protein